MTPTRFRALATWDEHGTCPTRDERGTSPDAFTTHREKGCQTRDVAVPHIRTRIRGSLEGSRSPVCVRRRGSSKTLERGHSLSEVTDSELATSTPGSGQLCRLPELRKRSGPAVAASVGCTSRRSSGRRSRKQAASRRSTPRRVTREESPGTCPAKPLEFLTMTFNSAEGGR
jgi:hypothetical protein